MVSEVGGSQESFSLKRSEAISMGGVLSGRNIKRLHIGGIDNDIVKIAAKKLKGNNPSAELEKFKQKGTYGVFRKSVTVSLGNKVYEINIGSCAKRLGLTRKEVFNLAKEGKLEEHIKSLRNSNIYESLITESTDQATLPKVASFALSIKNELLDQLKREQNKTFEIPGLSKDDYRLEIKDNKIYFIQKGYNGQFFEIDLTSHLIEDRASDCLASVKDQNANAMSKRIIDDGISNVPLDKLKVIIDYVDRNKDTLLEKARTSPGKTLHIRPSNDNLLPRSIQVNGDGNVYVHFNKRKQGDRLIGKGSFKKVQFALHLNSGNILAISKIRLSSVHQKREIQIAGANKENAFLKRFENEPTIVKAQSQSVKTGKEYIKKSATLQPYYDSGDLKLAINDKKLTDEEKLRMTYDMLEACSAIQKAGVIHRDIKPANFFLTSDNGNRRVLLGDFGLACDSSNSQDKKNVAGTFRYLAPEYCRSLYISNDETAKVTTSKLDSWSLGLTLYEMFGKSFPIQYSSRENFYDKLSNLTQSDVDAFEFTGIPPQVADLIKDLLKVNSEERLTATDALKKYGEDLKRLTCSPKNSPP
jgi:hypothetical protein